MIQKEKNEKCLNQLPTTGEVRPGGLILQPKEPKGCTGSDLSEVHRGMLHSITRVLLMLRLTGE